MRSSLQIVLLFILSCVLIFSCNKEEFTYSPSAKLQFAVDTVTFDTVFTTIGSTTKWFTVKNPNKQAVTISKIFLGGGKNSPFRLNINGLIASEDQNVEISAGDSLYIFVEVTVDPAGQNNPMVIHDSVVFNLNGNMQDVDLIAFGQDFHLVDGEIIKTQHWANDKPYLVYNSVLVDSLESLTIDPGCRIHFHKGSGMFVKGTLNVNGTFEEPVKFLGDRLEKDYENVPGQWGAFAEFDDNSLYIFGGIHFLIGSKDNTINYAEIKNANKGIQIDSMGFSENPVLILSNTIVENMSLNCLDARTTYLKASNCVFANSGSYTVALRFGGDYEFNHCTVANYYSLETRRDAALIMNNYFMYNNVIYGYDFKADFANCIIYGNNNEEITLSHNGPGLFLYSFKDCLLKTNLGPGSGFENSVFNAEPRFAGIKEQNYAIDSLSPAKNIGDKEVAKLYPFDLKNNSRLEDEGPDLGAIEWTPTKKKD